MTTNSRRQYTIVLTPDFEDQVYTVTVPALPGIVTEGSTVEEAIEMAKDAIRTHVEGLLADGEKVPEETMRPQAITLEVDVPIPASAALSSAT
jgi:predicted RNase H-like HicB family nuclease